MQEIVWKPVIDMDMEDGTHTCYSTIDRKGRFVWLTQMSDNSWDVELATQPNKSIEFITMATCKTLASAKRWARMYLNII